MRTHPRNGRSLRDPGAAPEPRHCDYPGCTEGGAHKAPRSRDDLRSYYWFCLEHVRLYNRAWDFFKGMSREEIEAFQREDVTGHRPTWPMGEGSANQASSGFQRIHDAFGIFANAWFGGRRRDGSRRRDVARRSPRDKALAVMELDHPVSREELKLRYKQLVKRHHPDANGGCKRSEERLKLINQAYTYLGDSGYM